jgi:hypothetical protein
VGGNSANTAPDIDDPSLNSEGYNLIQNTSGVTINETLNGGTNITGVVPQFNPLADNGGSTQTHSLKCNSPAIDKGKAFGLTTDQRGLLRPFDFANSAYPNATLGDGADIGAFEIQSADGCLPTAVSPSMQTTNEDIPVTITLTGQYALSNALTFNITQIPTNGTLGSLSAPNCTFTTLMTCTATVTYTPNLNANGTDLFKFRVTTNPGGLQSVPADVNITVNSVNDAPSFTKGPDQTVPENAAAQTVNNWATNISPGPANESGQALTITVSNNNNSLFSVQPAISPTGTLTYAPAPNTSGSADVTVTLQDNGGTANNGIDTSQQTFKITVDPAGGYIRFSASNYSVAEGGVATITVQRVGNLSRAVTVDFTTADNSNPAAQLSCVPVSGNTTASSRCDFDNRFGRIRFAAGDGADTTFTVMTTQDNYVEGSETVPLTLFNPTNGAALMNPSTATLTIQDDEVEPSGNTIDDTGNFVEQLYEDFLNRPSDPSGKAFWIDNIEKCNAAARRPAGMTVAQCKQYFRVVTAGAFFLSIEFRATAGTAYLTNKVAFNGIPTFAVFELDAQELGNGYVFGEPGGEAILEANKVAYYNEFTGRTAFVNAYGGLSDQQYVDTLIQNTGVPFTLVERNSFVNGLNNHTETRATVLRKICDKPQLTVAEFNSLFVLTEYFGFLRRNPDLAGFNFWVSKMNQFKGDFIGAEMVRSFIESSEYRGRFGP